MKVILEVIGKAKEGEELQARFLSLEFSRGEKVYTQVIENTKTDTLMPIIREKIRPDSIVYSDRWKAYKNYILIRTAYLL